MMLSPAPATVTAQGPLHIQSPGHAAQCRGTFKVAVSAAGEGRVTLARTGDADPHCPITALNLPWRIHLTSRAGGVVRGVAWTSPYFKLCGPLDLPLKVAPDGLWKVGKLTPPHECAMTGDLTTRPREVIAPRSSGGF